MNGKITYKVQREFRDSVIVSETESTGFNQFIESAESIAKQENRANNKGIKIIKQERKGHQKS